MSYIRNTATSEQKEIMQQISKQNINSKIYYDILEYSLNNVKASDINLSFKQILTTNKMVEIAKQFDMNYEYVARKFRNVIDSDYDIYLEFVKIKEKRK